MLSSAVRERFASRSSDNLPTCWPNSGVASAHAPRLGPRRAQPQAAPRSPTRDEHRAGVRMRRPRRAEQARANSTVAGGSSVPSNRPRITRFSNPMFTQAFTQSPYDRRKPRGYGTLGGTATGIRTRVSAVRGRRPSPLDDSGASWTGRRSSSTPHARVAGARRPSRAARLGKRGRRRIRIWSPSDHRSNGHKPPCRAPDDAALRSGYSLITSGRPRLWRNW
jgi:hypothetical protein